MYLKIIYKINGFLHTKIIYESKNIFYDLLSLYSKYLYFDNKNRCLFMCFKVLILEFIKSDNIYSNLVRHFYRNKKFLYLLAINIF